MERENTHSRDCVYIKDLLVRTIIGINDWERRERQDVLISLCMYTDTRPAGHSDDIADALNYRSVAKRIIQLAETHHFYLVERLAEAIAQVCIREFHVERVRVQVEKPGAVRFARTVGVSIERVRADYQEASHA